VRRDREAQDDVPQEREALVRLAPLVRPRGMGERLPGQILRQLVEKGLECGGQGFRWLVPARGR
jgi:hypothetical protein